MKPEIRVFDGMHVEKRADSETRTITGYAAVFNSATDIGGMFREEIKPGAFAEAIGRDDVRALINHNENFVLGRTKAGTLSLAEDEKGLAIEIALPDTQLARDLAIIVERGDVSQMSFAFSMEGGAQKWDESGEIPVRTIDKIGKLYDVSIVTYPAYPDTEAAVRSLQEFRDARNQQNHQAAARRIRLKMNLGIIARRA